MLPGGSLTLEELRPLGTPNGNSLREPGNHVRCRTTIVRERRLGANPLQKRGTFPIRQEPVDQRPVRDPSRRMLLRQVQDHRSDQRESLCMPERDALLELLTRRNVIGLRQRPPENLTNANADRRLMLVSAGATKRVMCNTVEEREMQPPDGRPGMRVLLGRSIEDVRRRWAFVVAPPPRVASDARCTEDCFRRVQSVDGRLIERQPKAATFDGENDEPSSKQAQVVSLAIRPPPRRTSSVQAFHRLRENGQAPNTCFFPR